MWDVDAALTVPASETRRACQAIGGGAVVVVCCVSLSVLTVGLTSSAAVALCVYARHRCLDTVSVTAVPLEAPADGDLTGVEMSTAGRATAGSRDDVALGTLTRWSAAQHTSDDGRQTPLAAQSNGRLAWGLAGSGGDGRCQVCRGSAAGVDVDGHGVVWVLVLVWVLMHRTW